MMLEKTIEVLERFKMEKIDLSSPKENSLSYSKKFYGEIPKNKSSSSFPNKVIIFADSNLVSGLDTLAKKGFGEALFTRNPNVNSAWLSQFIEADLLISSVHYAHEELLLNPEFDLNEFLYYMKKNSNKGLVVYNSFYGLDKLEKYFVEEKNKISGIHLFNFSKLPNIPQEKKEKFQEKKIFIY